MENNFEKLLAEYEALLEIVFKDLDEPGKTYAKAESRGRAGLSLINENHI